MKIGLIDVDGHHFPNLALGKISRYHKQQGDSVEWYSSFEHYDKVYMAKVFTFTQEYGYFVNADEVEKGGTGYDIHKVLPDCIDRLQPDYSIYKNVDNKTAYGFLTRGCPNRCSWCIVPKKEGKQHPYMDVEEIAIEGRTNLILMDNNVLASDYGLQQIEKIIEKGYRVDFNQGIDSRLVTDNVAKLLAKVRWIHSIRFGCDTPQQIVECERAMKMIDSYRKVPATYLLYTIIGKDINECYHRLSYFRGNKRVRIVGQPYRDFNNSKQVIPQWQKDMAHWATKHQLYASCDFKDFEPRKGFKCKRYFDK